MSSIYAKSACKICILGANGHIGRHLALNLKLNKYVTELSLYGMNDMAFLKEDLSHIDSQAHVSAFSGGEKSLINSLKCSDLVVIVAGQAHSKTHTSREALFEANAELMLKFMKAISTVSHNNMPFIYIITNPVNTLVPLCGEFLKDLGCFNSRKLIGSSSVDTMRARTFLGQLRNYDPSKIIVPVVGGHSSNSITPLISQTEPRFKMSIMEQKQLAERIINGGSDVSRAYKSISSAFLSMAYCIGKFCNSICRAIYGDKNVVEVGYVPADVNECEYFCCNFSVNSEGITECHRLPPMSSYELELYCNAIKDVKENIDRAKQFYKKHKLEKTLQNAEK